MKGLVVDGRARVDVDHHAGGAAAAEEALQDAGQFAVPERHHLRGTRPVERIESFGSSVRGLPCVSARARGVEAAGGGDVLVALVVPKDGDAAAQSQQGGVDVCGLLHPLAVGLLSAALRAG